MRSFLLLTLLALPIPALAERPRPTYIDVGMSQRIGPLQAPTSRIIYMHRCPLAGCPVFCPPEGCRTAAGDDDSRTNRSRIAVSNTTIGQFTQSDDVWLKMLSCVRATFAPFDVTVTDVDPGPMTPHYEHIVGGRAQELLGPDASGIGGVAPADCNEIPNAMTFTFDVYGSDHLTLCWTAAQEIAHGFGLEHELNAKDPLTYLEGYLPKRFQAADAQCGEGIPRTCMCTGGVQNSYEHILAMFGPGVPTPPTVMVRSPSNGKTVQPGFVTRVNATDDVAIDHVEVLVDGTKVGESFVEPYTIVAEDTVAPGPHQLEVRAYDVQGTPGSTILDITMGPPCTASSGCSGVDVCVSGVCLPGPDAPGGLGYACLANSECLSRNCQKASGETGGHCTEACDLSLEGECPSGFDCIPDATGAGVCFPNDSGGCCDTGASGKGPAMLGLVVLAIVLRRRRAR